MIPLLLAVLAVAQSAAPGASVRLLHLDLEVTPDFPAESLSARASFRIRNVSDHPVSRVPVLLNRLLHVVEARDQMSHPLSVEQSIVAMAGFEQLQVRSALIALETPIAPGDSTVVTIDYSGWIAPYTETGMLYVQDHVDSAFTILRSDAFAIPVLAPPSMEGLEASQGEFTSNVRVRVPKGFVAASGGRAMAPRPDDSTTTWEYAATRPAPFLIVIIARYSLLERRGIRIYHFPGDSAGARRVAARAGQALALLTRWYGPLRDAPSLTIMEIPDGWGSQASLAGGIIQTAAAFRSAARLSELYHELSHLWNALDLDLPSARWNEGLATFLQYRIAAVLDRERLDSAEERLFARLKAMTTREPDLATVPFRDFGAHNLTDASYRLGGLMFALLYARMGAESFDRAYRSVWNTKAESGVTFQDLQQAFQAAAPGQGMERFFDDWVATTRWTTAVKSARSFRELR